MAFTACFFKRKEIDMAKPTIEITEDEYKRLQMKACLLHALQSADVEKWDGYNEAVAIFEDTCIEMETTDDQS